LHDSACPELIRKHKPDWKSIRLKADRIMLVPCPCTYTLASLQADALAELVKAQAELAAA
jgi:hypothetical protein